MWCVSNVVYSIDLRSVLISAVYWTINWRIVLRFVLSRHLFSCIDLLRDTHRVLRKSQRLSFSTLLVPDVGRFTFICVSSVWCCMGESGPSLSPALQQLQRHSTSPRAAWQSWHCPDHSTSGLFKQPLYCLLVLDLCRGCSNLCLRSDVII